MISISELYKIFLQHPVVQTDTRQLKAGCIFFALKGENFDGNHYAMGALEAGAAYAVVDDASFGNEPNCLMVQDVLSTLQQLALYHRNQFEIPFLAITGSNGKTTTKELVAAVLAKKYNVLATKGNFNNHIGVPLTLLSLEQDHDFAIIEMGANHRNEIKAYCEWARPNFALINNCGKAHLEGFGGLEGVRLGKGELYDFIRETGGTIFRNADLDYLKSMANGISNQYTYGEFEGDVRAKIYEHEPFLRIARLDSGKEQIINTQLMGDYNLPNILAAVAVGQYFNVADSDIYSSIENYFPTNNRSEHRVVDGINVILDAYNANPSSMRAAIESFDKIRQPNKILILGAMRELGDESDAEHRDVFNFAKQFGWKQIVLVGDNFEQIAQENNVPFFENATETKKWFGKYVSADDWVYIKGSRLTAMEKIIE